MNSIISSIHEQLRPSPSTVNALYGRLRGDEPELVRHANVLRFLIGLPAAAFALAILAAGVFNMTHEKRLPEAAASPDSYVIDEAEKGGRAATDSQMKYMQEYEIYLQDRSYGFGSLVIPDNRLSHSDEQEILSHNDSLRFDGVYYEATDTSYENYIANCNVSDYIGTGTVRVGDRIYDLVVAEPRLIDSADPLWQIVVGFGDNRYFIFEDKEKTFSTSYISMLTWEDGEEYISDEYKIDFSGIIKENVMTQLEKKENTLTYGDWYYVYDGEYSGDPPDAGAYDRMGEIYINFNNRQQQSWYFRIYGEEGSDEIIVMMPDASCHRFVKKQHVMNFIDVSALPEAEQEYTLDYLYNTWIEMGDSSLYDEAVITDPDVIARLEDIVTEIDELMPESDHRSESYVRMLGSNGGYRLYMHGRYYYLPTGSDYTSRMVITDDSFYMSDIDGLSVELRDALRGIIANRVPVTLTNISTGETIEVTDADSSLRIYERSEMLDNYYGRMIKSSETSLSGGWEIVTMAHTVCIDPDNIGGANVSIDGEVYRTSIYYLEDLAAIIEKEFARNETAAEN